MCRQRGVTTALDNTWGAGLAFNGRSTWAGRALSAWRAPTSSVQALTKYPSGGGDVLMGSMITRDEALHLQAQAHHMRLGLGVGANDAEAVLRACPASACATARRTRRRARWRSGAASSRSSPRYCTRQRWPI
jgi:cystathionine beta-lyase